VVSSTIARHVLSFLSDRYTIGSNPKTFTTLAFYREIERRGVGLLDLVSQHLAGFAINNPFSTGKLTLAALASQSSGLPRAPVCGNIGPCSGEFIIESYRCCPKHINAHLEEVMNPPSLCWHMGGVHDRPSKMWRQCFVRDVVMGY
jgi:hypothetical protein